LRAPQVGESYTDDTSAGNDGRKIGGDDFPYGETANDEAHRGFSDGVAHRAQTSTHGEMLSADTKFQERVTRIVRAL